MTSCGRWDDRRLSLTDAGYETIPRPKPPLPGLPSSPWGSGGSRRAGGEPHAHEPTGKPAISLVSMNTYPRAVWWPLQKGDTLLK